MKYNEKGIPEALDDIESLGRIFDKQDNEMYFEKLRKELPWQEVNWKNEYKPNKLVFRYGEFERNVRKYDTLEEIISSLESSYETDIIGCCGEYYRNIDDFTPFQKFSYNFNVLILCLGGMRTFNINNLSDKECNDCTSVNLHNGELFHISYDKVRNIEYDISKNESESILFFFYIEKPYSKRNRHIRHINILGLGKIQVIFEGNASQFPKETVATILPSSFRSILEGNNTYRGERTDYNSLDRFEGVILRNILDQYDEYDEIE